MNKIKENIFIFAVSIIMATQCFAADSGVIERMSCTDLQNRINELNSAEQLSDSASEELAQLQEKYRKDCVKSAAGRRTVGRVTALTVAQSSSEPVQVETMVVLNAETVLNSFIEKQKENCSSLKTSIDSFKQNTSTSVDEIAKLQKQYEEDCSKYDTSSAVVSETVVEETLDPEQVAANIESGLCADGSKPNRFGCCEGETFKDIGNLVFACCPEDGSECYPPINTGTLL